MFEVRTTRKQEVRIEPFFGDTPLSKICTFDVERYKKQRLEENAQHNVLKDGTPIYKGKTKPGTINRELAALSHLFNKAIEWEWIDRRPTRIRRYQEGSGRITYLTIEQMKVMIECAKQDQNAQIYPFIIIGLETSMRRMEILTIRRENVDLQRLTIYIPKAKTGRVSSPSPNT